MNKAVIVISLSKAHLHYCKALLSSIRHFHPDLPIIILKDGNFSTSWLNKMANVRVLESNLINELHGLDLYGLLNKLNLFWLPEMGLNFDFYIHFDADSILTNSLDSFLLMGNFDFGILQGRTVNYNNDNDRGNLIKYAFDPMEFSEIDLDLEHLYYFSSGHMIISRSLFESLKLDIKKYRADIQKDFSTTKRFKFGDQGFLNAMINFYKVTQSAKVLLADVGIYGYLNRGDFPLVTKKNIINRADTGVLFIHYTISARKLSIAQHNFGDILSFFYEKSFQGRIYDYYIFEIQRYIQYFIKKVKRRLNYELNKLMVGPNQKN